MTVDSTWLPPADEQIVPELLERNRETRPDHPSLVVDELVVSHREMHERSLAMAAGLRALGVGPRDVVACLLPNCAEIAYAWNAGWYLGSIHVALNTALRGTFLLDQLRTARPKVILVDATLLDDLLRVLPETDFVEHIVVRDAPAAGLPPGHRWAVHPLAEVAASGGPSPAPARMEAEAISTIMFTGGTTGPSKAAAYSRGYVLNLTRRVVTNLRVDRDSIWYQPSPMFHNSGAINCIVAPALVGHTGCSATRFSASGFLDATRRLGATHSAIFGPLAVMLWNQPERPDDADNPLRVSYGYVPEDLHQPFEKRFGLRIVATYALSEAIPVTLDDYDTPSKPGYSSPVPEIDVRVFDADDREVPHGVAGEIVVRPRRPLSMFSGYYRDPAATTAAWRNLWFHTGDIGRFDPDGAGLAFVDRKADYIRRRGENVSCWEVERALREHTAISDAAVHGVPSDVGEEDVKACVELVAGAHLDPREFFEYCVEAMPYFAVPRYLDIIEALPRSPIGRVTKQPLRAAPFTPTTVDRQALGITVPRR